MPFSVVIVDPSPPAKEVFLLFVIATGTATAVATITSAIIPPKMKYNFLRFFFGPAFLFDWDTRPVRAEVSGTPARLVALLSEGLARGVLVAVVNTLRSGELPVTDCEDPAAERFDPGPSLAVVEASLVKTVDG